MSQKRTFSGSPWRKVVKRKRTLGGSCWFYLECGHMELRRGEKANTHPAKLRCQDCLEKAK